MIAIDDVLISDEIAEAQFVCDLSRCKGGCCEDGDAGAPLEKAEKKIVDEAYAAVEAYMTEEGKAEVRRQGLYHYDREFGWVTPTIDGKICAYGFYDDKGIIKCAFEQAYNDGKISWKKPISCHLYPIKVTHTKTYTMLNYEPRESLCSPACALGEKLRMPVYRFLKEPLVRKFGQSFYDTLHQIAETYFSAEKTS